MSEINNLSFLDWLEIELGTGNWAVLHRKSRRTKGKYDVCMTLAEYHRHQCEYVKEGGNPDNVDPSAAKEAGLKQIWVKA